MNMRTKRNAVFAAAMILALPVAASAQGVVGGAEQGAREGSHAAGPVGGVVGGAVGAVTGGVAGLLGADQRPRFHDYVVREHHPSYTYNGQVVVGGVLPDEGVTYYDVPPEYNVRDYRYTVINGTPVLVDPRTHRIVEVIE
ncbi:MAG TPA: DUF1236 domain-containing protein [Beijerinckiaceae bacterium]|jgi:hypothetical protein|nr:DUF1236 domain-containing protein [Beijerinckiaceae bacterium]